ncbi:MAG: hypothetical protein ACRCZO_17285 [Cetobacterium sp.]
MESRFTKARNQDVSGVLENKGDDVGPEGQGEHGSSADRRRPGGSDEPYRVGTMEDIGEVKLLQGAGIVTCFEVEGDK